MLPGPFLFLALAVGIAAIVVATTRYKVHPFLALLVVAYAIGLCGGLGTEKSVTAITGGFGGTVGYIGIVIACGCIIGRVLEGSGCALVMAQAIVGLIGRSRSVLAMSCTGAVISIPVFCDSGYVILSPLARSLARASRQSLAAFAVALSMGLYATHCLVPPTPGPIAVAGELRADIGSVIMWGLLVAVPVIATTYAYARFVGRRIFIDPDPPAGETAAAGAGTSATETDPALPQTSAAAAFAPILTPVALIALKSIADLPGAPLGTGVVRKLLSVCGDPNVALVLGVILAWIVARRFGRTVFADWCGQGLRDAGTIILITAAGGALGGVLRATPMASMVGEGLGGLHLGAFSILLPFIVAVGLKTAIGSSTVAMITSASLVSPLLSAMGLGAGHGPVLATLAIASGAMMFSHVNDSYFWVITQMSGMTVARGYQLITVASGIAGATAMAVVFLLGLVLL